MKVYDVNSDVCDGILVWHRAANFSTNNNIWVIVVYIHVLFQLKTGKYKLYCECWFMRQVCLVRLIKLVIYKTIRLQFLEEGFHNFVK